MRLGFHYHIPAFKDADGVIWTPGEQGRFLESLATQCEHLICFLHTPLEAELSTMNYPLRASNIELVSIGPHLRLPVRVLRARQFANSLKAHLARLDALLLRGPSPLLAAFADVSGDLPLILLLVADNLAGIDELPNKSALTKWVVKLWACWNRDQQLRASRRALTLVNSHRLYETWQPYLTNLREVRTTTLYSSDFFARNDTCQSKPYHILFTGRVNRTKGLIHIAEAVLTLVEEGYELVFDVVGAPERAETVAEEIQEMARKRGASERIVFHGFKQVGPELFDYYKQADVYVIASTSDFEGFPRTIWEAMANSLPVVATTVGSIPHYLENEQSALLIPPKDSAALVEPLKRLFADASLRQRLIHNGFQLAQSNTLEARTRELYSLLEDWYHQAAASRTQAKSESARSFFDQTQRYLKNTVGIQMRIQIAHQFVDHPEQSHILDVGCGNGAVSLSFLSQNNRLTLLDISSEMLEVARSDIPSQLAGQVSLVNTDINTFPNTEPHDVVLCFGVLAHVSDPTAIIERLADLTRAGGICILQLTDQGSPVAKINQAFRAFRERLRPVYGYQLTTMRFNQIVQIAREKGFQVETYRRYSVALPGMGLLPGQLYTRIQQLSLTSGLLSSIGSEVVLKLRKAE